jgi:hypothetical protein
MAARKARSGIEGRVRDAGFTPSVRDVPAIAALLAAEDEDLARDAERALVRVGPTLATVVRAVAQQAPPVARARLVRAVGAVATEGEDAGAVAWLVEELAEGEGKRARYAATALGKLRARAGEAERALLQAWRGTAPTELRRALADALGKVGTSPSADALGAYETEDPELRRLVARALLRLGRTAARLEASAIDDRASLDRPWPVVFRCRAGLESLLVEELGPSWSARAVEEGRVQGVLRGPLSRAREARVAMSFALVVGPVTGDDEGALVRDAVAGDDAWRLLRTFTRGPVRFRFAFESGGHRRGFVHRVADEARALRPELMNDPTSSPWEVLVRELDAGRARPPSKVRAPAARMIALEIEPRALEDERFAYRIADVPAASHPTIAAALARAAGLRVDDVVWDPFVGSALELIERARLGPYAALHGTDIDPAALEAARANLARAEVAATLALGDSTTQAPPGAGVTLAITNPPMGRRVARGELAPLMDRIVHQVARTLAPGGRFVWLSPMPARTRARLEQEGLTIDLARTIDMGGFEAELQRARKA